jgi:hypothetical protein
MARLTRGHNVVPADPVHYPLRNVPEWWRGANSGYTLRQHEELLLADNLAFIAAKAGGQGVTAAAIEERRDEIYRGSGLCVAADDCREDDPIQFLREYLTRVSGYARRLLQG